MKIHWLHRGNSHRVVVFCNGWGMDHTPFSTLDTDDLDVVTLHDFSDEDGAEQLLAQLEAYEERILIGWSMGVWGGQKLFADKSGLFSRRVAVNGTLCPVDEQYGIPEELFAGTMAGWSESSRRKFYLRMCSTKESTREFLENQPVRTIEDQKRELLYYLENTDCLTADMAIYDEVVVSDKDRIVTTDNQIRFWGRQRINLLPGSHFIFNSWSSWDEMLSATASAVSLSCRL